MSGDYQGLSYSEVYPYGEPSSNGTYPTNFYIDLPSLNPFAVFDGYDGDMNPVYYSVSGAYEGISYFAEDMYSQVNEDSGLDTYIDLNYDRDWYQTIQAVKTINGYNYGVAQYKEWNGSVVTLTSSATGQYLNGADFDFNAAGTSTLYTSINYVGKDYGRIEESLVGKEAETYVVTIGQKAGADGLLSGTNSAQKSYTNSYVYKDGLDNSDKSDNVLVTATNKVVQTNSINTTTASDILTESYKKDTSASSSYGAGSNAAYTQKSTEASSSTASQTFSADSSIAESYKSNSVTTYTYGYAVKFTADDVANSNGTLSATAAAAGFKATGTQKETDTSDYANSTNADGNYKEASTDTYKYEETYSTSGFNHYYPIEDTFHNYSSSLNFTATEEVKSLEDEQKAISEYTDSYKNAVSLTYSNKDITAGTAESLTVTSTVSHKQSYFGDEKNNVYTDSTEITKLTYSNTQTTGTTVTQLGDSIDLAGKATYTAGTDSSGNELAPTLAISITTGKFTEYNDVSESVDYEMTTAASTLNINYATTNLNGGELMSIDNTISNVNDYFDQTNSNGFLYGLEDYQSSLVNFMLLGNNTITIKGVNVEVNAGLGNDTITGGTGDDIITGGRGADVISGGLGNDTYIVDENSGSALGTVGGTFSGFDTITTTSGDTINFTTSINDYNTTGGLTAANFTNANTVATFLNGFSLNDGDAIYVKDTTANKGALYYYAGDVDDSGTLNASDIALIGVTTGVVDFGSAAPANS